MSDSPEAKGLPTIDVHEYGGKKDGVRQTTNRRLFMQLLVFRGAHDDSAGLPGGVAGGLLRRIIDHRIAGVVYADAMDPYGFALLTWGEDPAHFATSVRLAVASAAQGYEVRSELGMLGRTYSTGHEPELEWSLLQRPIENVMNPEYAWHVWYPLRRKGSFAALEPIDQSHILREHAALGMAYGQANLAHDIRLACHGLDASDNEFVIGLVGRELHPLSHLVQAMRKTRQTREYIEKMGPFFIGHVLGRSSPVTA